MFCARISDNLYKGFSNWIYFSNQRNSQYKLWKMVNKLFSRILVVLEWKEIILLWVEGKQLKECGLKFGWMGGKWEFLHSETAICPPHTIHRQGVKTFRKILAIIAKISWNRRKRSWNGKCLKKPFKSAIARLKMYAPAFFAIVAVPVFSHKNLQTFRKTRFPYQMFPHFETASPELFFKLPYYDHCKYPIDSFKASFWVDSVEPSMCFRWNNPFSHY